MSDEQTFILTPAARAGLDAAWIRILNERHPGLRFRVVPQERDALDDRRRTGRAETRRALAADVGFGVREGLADRGARRDVRPVAGVTSGLEGG